MLHLTFLHHSGILIQIIHPLSATFIWTFRFNLLHIAVTFHHFFTVSLWAQNLPVQKILSSTLVCFCRTDLIGSTPFTGLTCSSVFMFSSLLFCFSYSYVRQTKFASSLVNFWAHNNVVFDLLFFDLIWSHRAGLKSQYATDCKTR